MAAAVKATLRDWVMVTRPWSITAPLVPFMVGLGFCLGTGRLEPFAMVRWSLALASALLLVLACNLFNTWGDERSGVDRVEGAVLTSPQVQEGKFTLRQIFIYGCVLFVLAGALGLPTLLYCRDIWAVRDWSVNWPLLVAATIGFLGAVNYSTGVKYKYLGLGVPMVAMLEGTLYLLVVVMLLEPMYVLDKLERLAQGRLDHCEIWIFLLFTLPVASLVGVILHGNDMRDIATDRRAGVRSLASALGPGWALAAFFVLHLVPYIVPGLMTVAMLWKESADVVIRGLWVVALPFLALPFTARILWHALRDWRADRQAPKWLDLEQGSGLIHFLFGVLYALMFGLTRFI